MKTLKKIALITGATSGIGKETAILLSKNNFDLIICGRRNDRLVEIEKNLAGNGSKVYFKSFDIRDKNEVDDFFKTLPDEWKNIDVLLNNAGLASGLSSFADGEIDDWEKMIDTNVKGLLYISKHVIPLMTEKKSGHIINIGSIAGKEIYPYGNVYCATKFAVDALTKAMRRELAEKNIKVTGIYPGAVETEFSLVRFKGNKEKASKVYEGYENLVANDIAQAVFWSINRPDHVNINEIVIMPQAQPAAGIIVKNQ
ncbi:MAG: SDR family NAD(P)-dependent oxidoreductase [Bacteroidetes bacterium]|nr:SDR family NAD(P)-dependent oxidoreductase [Bacteroidota bacterium]